MSEKFEILLNFVKDLSSETPDAESYIFVKDNIKNYPDGNTWKNKYQSGVNPCKTNNNFTDGKMIDNHPIG